MKPALSLLVLVILFVSILAGCAPGANQSKGVANQHDVVAGFWLGFWQGFIAPFVYVASLFKNDLCIYEIHNNGAWYNFGYLFGLACLLGGGGNRTAGRKPRNGAGVVRDNAL
jgi:hypothetical protein